MTVDPILAQGFTMAMEGSRSLASSVCDAILKSKAKLDDKSGGEGPSPAPSSEMSTTLAFDPRGLRRELLERQEFRVRRLICLLRATELVQALGQPRGGTVSGFLNTKVLRPVLAKLTPNFVKVPIFDAVLKYSLGLLLGNHPSKDTLKKF